MAAIEVSALKVPAPGGSGGLSAELTRPDEADRLLVLAHGAGADFRHANILGISEALARQGIASLRFNFPFISKRKKVANKGMLSFFIQMPPIRDRTLLSRLLKIAGIKDR